MASRTETHPPTPLRVAIMAALSIADEYLKSRKQEIEEAEKLERISAKLLSRLEQSEKLDRVKAAEVPEATTPRFSPLRATQEYGFVNASALFLRKRAGHTLFRWK